jgi:hypothetical protein
MYVFFFNYTKFFAIYFQKKFFAIDCQAFKVKVFFRLEGKNGVFAGTICNLTQRFFIKILQKTEKNVFLQKLFGVVFVNICGHANLTHEH